MFRIAICLLLTSALAGCVTAQERTALASKDDATCQYYGAKPGTDEYLNCRTQIAKNQNTHGVVTASNSNSASPTHCTTTVIGGVTDISCN
jgi:hypothetical protein